MLIAQQVNQQRIGQRAACLLLRILRGVIIAVATLTCACLAGSMADGQTIQLSVASDAGDTSLSDHQATAPARPQVTRLGGGGCAPMHPCQDCPRCLSGVDCRSDRAGEASWGDMAPMDFDVYGPGGYAGPPRLAHLRHYRLRPGDQLQVVFLITRRQNNGAYKLEVGDEVLVESITDADLTRGSLESGLRIQPDGSITLRLIGQVHAAGLTIEALREQINRLYRPLYPEPAIDVTPVRTNRLAEDIREAVGGQGGFNAQVIDLVVQPDGKIRLPGIGEVCVQGFTLEEMKTEINLRYADTVVGLQIEPLLTQQAPHFVYVLGEVAAPNRIELTTPTTVLGAIAAAGGSLPGANLRQVVIFRRAEDWRLISTMLDLQGAIYGKKPSPADEIWLRDGYVVILPAKPITRFNWFVRQVFTEGAYGVIPFGGVSFNFGDQF